MICDLGDPMSLRHPVSSCVSLVVCYLLRVPCCVSLYRHFCSKLSRSTDRYDPHLRAKHIHTCACACIYIRVCVCVFKNFHYNVDTCMRFRFWKRERDRKKEKERDREREKERKRHSDRVLTHIQNTDTYTEIYTDAHKYIKVSYSNLHPP